MNNHKSIFIGILLLTSALFFLPAHGQNSTQLPPASTSSSFKVIGYLFNKKTDLDQLPYQYLTHINYSFALPASDASGAIQPVPQPNYLRELSKKAHAHHVRVFLSIGGWEIGDGGGNDTRFELLANSPASRSEFVHAAMKIVRQFDLDGIDIDWEYPDPIEPSATNYVLLMKKLSDSLHHAGKKLSAAIVSFRDRYGYGIKKAVFRYVDWFNIMAYDYKNGENMPHSPYWLSVRSFDYWVGDRGMPNNKAILGLNFGFYKYLIRMGADPYADVFMTDKNVFRRHPSTQKSSTDTLYYNGIVTVKEKTKLALKRGNGIMMWAVANDTTGKYSLLKAIHDTFIHP